MIMADEGDKEAQRLLRAMSGKCVREEAGEERDIGF